MPLIDSPPDAAARVYARSLFELADKQGGQHALEETLGELEEVLEIARGNPQFAELLSSPSVSTADRAKSLDAIFKGRVSDLTYRFLQVLNDKGRAGHLASITSAFDHELQTRFGRVEVDVYTVDAISSDLIGTIRDRLSRVLGKDVVLHPYIDPAMLGGVKFRIGDQLIDGSLATRLRKMKDQLDNEGGANLRAKISGILDQGGR